MHEHADAQSLPVPGPRDSEDDRQRKLAALRTRLHEEAQAMRTPEDWARCLRLVARLPGETFANILLISAQRPGATILRGYDPWQAMGRQVSRQEQGIAIFSAVRRPGAGDRNPVPSWRDAERVGYLWDLSQASGPTVTARSATSPLPGRTPPGLCDALYWLARREGFAVERAHGCPEDDVTMWTARRIRIPPGPDEYQIVWALAHQLGHVLLHEPVSCPPGTTTSGCTGVPKTEADSVAYVICIRCGIPTAHQFPAPPAWAGRDLRAQPAGAILAVGERVTAAAARITRHLDHQLPVEQASLLVRDGVERTPARPPPKPPGTPASWPTPRSSSRASSPAAGDRTTCIRALTDHLRTLGHHDDAIQAAGLARPSSRGTLIDHFRDRVMLPVLDEHGTPAGFIGRARPGSRPEIPKYLNSPETSTYRKGDLLFGLHQARGALARDAVPVIAEGPFDAIAITIADPAQRVGLAPCGTALTSQQIAALAAVSDLPRTGVLTAFDNDEAGRKAAARAYGILRPATAKLGSVLLAAKDPAEILQRDGPAALRTILQDQIQPLSAMIIDAAIKPWERQLQDTGGPLLAMRDVAKLIAHLLPPDTTTQIRQITRDREIGLTDDLLHPVDNPELTEIARLLPADTPYQIMQVADRLGFDVSEVLAEVANAVTEDGRDPKGLRRIQRADVEDRHPACSPAQLTDSSFPKPFLVPQHCVWHTHPPGVTSPVRGNTAPSRRQAPPST